MGSLWSVFIRTNSYLTPLLWCNENRLKEGKGRDRGASYTIIIIHVTDEGRLDQDGNSGGGEKFRVWMYFDGTVHRIC